MRTSSSRPVAMPQLRRARHTGDIVGPPALAGVEPVLGLVVVAGSDCEIRTPEPNPIIVGCEARGLVELGPDELDRVGLCLHLDMQPRQVDGQLRGAFTGRSQVLPALHDQLTGIGVATLYRECWQQEDAQARSIIAGIARGVVTSCSAAANRPRSSSSVMRASIARDENDDPGVTPRQASRAA